MVREICVCLRKATPSSPAEPEAKAETPAETFEAWRNGRKIVWKVKEELPKSDEEIRVTAAASVSACVSRPATVFNELKKPYVEIVDEYKPFEEGLDKVTDLRNVSVIEIKLSKANCNGTTKGFFEQEALDSDKGCQPPIDKSLVKEFDPEEETDDFGSSDEAYVSRPATVFNELKKPYGKGKDGKGKKGKSKSKGKYDDYDEPKGKGKSSKGKGKSKSKSFGYEDSYSAPKSKGETGGAGEMGGKGTVVKGNGKGGKSGGKGGHDGYVSKGTKGGKGGHGGYGGKGAKGGKGGYGKGGHDGYLSVGANNGRAGYAGKGGNGAKGAWEKGNGKAQGKGKKGKKGSAKGWY